MSLNEEALELFMENWRSSWRWLGTMLLIFIGEAENGGADEERTGPGPADGSRTDSDRLFGDRFDVGDAEPSPLLIPLPFPTDDCSPFPAGEGLLSFVPKGYEPVLPISFAPFLASLASFCRCFSSFLACLAASFSSLRFRSSSMAMLCLIASIIINSSNVSILFLRELDLPG